MSCISLLFFFSPPPPIIIIFTAVILVVAVVSAPVSYLADQKAQLIMFVFEIPVKNHFSFLCFFFLCSIDSCAVFFNSTTAFFFLLCALTFTLPYDTLVSEALRSKVCWY